MARPLRIEYQDAFYHIIQRGVERKNIFFSDKDKEKFLPYLDSAHQAYNAIIHTYILMNNHYHIILGKIGAVLKSATLQKYRVSPNRMAQNLTEFKSPENCSQLQ